VAVVAVAAAAAEAAGCVLQSFTLPCRCSVAVVVAVVDELFVRSIEGFVASVRDPNNEIDKNQSQ
jgi:hypothetical protein